MAAWPPALLFAPDAFSEAPRRPQPLAGPDLKFVLALAAGYFAAIGPVHAVASQGRFDRAAPANGFVLKLEAARGAYALKIVARPDILDSLDPQVATMRWLAERSPLCPPVVLADGGAATLPAGGSHRCYVTPWIAGAAYRAEPSEIISVGQALPAFARLVAAVPENVRPTRRRDPYMTDRDRAVLQAVAAERRHWPALFGETAASLFGEAWPALAREIAAAEIAAERVNGGQWAFGHIDLHPHNLICADGSLRAVIDLDATYVCPRPLPLAFATLKLLKQVHVRLGRGDLDRTAALAAADAYRHAIAREAGRLGLGMADLAATARLEALRRFLNVCRYALEGTAIPWNGPLVHLGALAEADILFFGKAA